MILKCSVCHGEVRCWQKHHDSSVYAYKCYGKCGSYKEEFRCKAPVVYVGFKRVKEGSDG